MRELTARTLSSDDGSLQLLSSVADTLHDSTGGSLLGAASLGPALEAMVAELSWKVRSGSRGPSRRESLVRTLQAYISHHLTDERLDVPHLARIHDVSERAVYSAFDLLGTTPAHYVRAERVRVARARLRSTSASVVDIACAVGFSDVSTFSRAFRRLTGESPAAYRAGAAAVQT